MDKTEDKAKEDVLAKDKTEKNKTEKEKTESDKLNDRIAAIIAEYEGIESNIPLSHEYWTLLNTRRAVLADEERKARVDGSAKKEVKAPEPTATETKKVVG